MPVIVQMFLAAIFSIFITCNNPSSNEDRKPTIYSCTGEPCTYYHIFDNNGKFVNEGSGPGVGTIYWNGTDYDGKKAECGKYSANIYVVSYGKTQSMTQSFLVADSTSIQKTGRTSCDSLKNNCSGSYWEIEADGIFGKQVQCICCQ